MELLSNVLWISLYVFAIVSALALTALVVITAVAGIRVLISEMRGIEDDQ